MTLTNQQKIIAAVAVVALAGGVWLYKSSDAKKKERGEAAYYDALRTAMSGNEALALADLRKVATRYNGTNAGSAARLAVTRLLYEQGKYEDGIKELKTGAPTESYEASVHVLAGAGYEQLGKFNEAAQEYEKAAQKAEFKEDQATYKASAARAYVSAGNKDKAVAIWKELAADESSPMAAEASVRLGELTAQVATK